MLGSCAQKIEEACSGSMKDLEINQTSSCVKTSEKFRFNLKPIHIQSVSHRQINDKEKRGKSFCLLLVSYLSLLFVTYFERLTVVKRFLSFTGQLQIEVRKIATSVY